jgi:hypothetical protein
MGRGKKRIGTRAQAAPLAAKATKGFRTRKIGFDALVDHKNRAAGEVISLTGGALIVDEQTDPMIARGLTKVMSVTQRPDGLYFVRFHDGTRALVDLEGNRVAFSDGTSVKDERLYGALARLAVSSSFDERDQEAAIRSAKMGLYLDDPSKPSHLRAATLAAEEALRGMEGTLTLNDKELQAQFGDNDVPAPSRPLNLPLRAPLGELAFELAAARAQVEETLAESGEEGPDSENMTQLKGMVFGWKDENEAAAQLNPILIEMGQQAAEALDEPIVDDAFIDDLYLNETFTQTLGSMFERYALGQRTFGLMGKQGTGKDTVIKAAAALLKRPMITLNGGKNVQLAEWMGGEALIPHEVRDDDGKLVAAFNITAVQYGKLARALQQPSVVHVSEIRGMEDQLLSGHDWMGSGVGAEASNRFFTINSPHGTETIEVNPECMICFSWNPDLDDWRPHPATMRRMGLFCFDPLSKEEEAERLAAMVNNMLEQNISFPEFHGKHFTQKDLIPIADFYQRFIQAVEANADEVSTEPSPQLFAYFYADVVLKAANQASSTDDAAAGDQAIMWSLSMLEGYMNQNLTRTERKKKLTTLLGTARTPLEELVTSVRAIVSPPEEEEQEVKPKAKAKPKPKPKPAAGA